MTDHSELSVQTVQGILFCGVRIGEELRRGIGNKEEEAAGPLGPRENAEDFNGFSVSRSSDHPASTCTAGALRAAHRPCLGQGFGHVQALSAAPAAAVQRLKRARLLPSHASGQRSRPSNLESGGNRACGPMNPAPTPTFARHSLGGATMGGIR